MRDGYTNGLVTYGGDRRIFGTQGDSFQVREGFFRLDELRQSGKSFPMAGKDAGFGLTVTLNRVRIIAPEPDYLAGDISKVIRSAHQPSYLS